MNGSPNGTAPPARASGLPPSPPISIAARSSNGGSPYPRPGPDGPMPSGPLPPGPGGPGGPGGPPGGPGGPRKYDPRALEAQLAEHHRVLKDYLTASLREDQSYMPHNRARDKLLRLSAIQFQELSTDVYDELLRREDERVARGPNGATLNVPRFLLPRNNFHPKRNQARQKLSTLAAKKFRELATDVLFELERRFPRFTGAERLAGGRAGSRPGTSLGMPPPIGAGMRRPSNASSIGPYSPGIIDNGGRGTPGPFGNRPYQNNTMVPNKGTMVEDDDDRSGDEDDPYDLERSAVRSSRRTTNRNLSMVGSEHPAAAEYQQQMTEMEARLADLENQLQEKDKAVEAEKERSSVLTENLERQLKSVETLNGTLQGELDRLQTDNGTDDWRSRYESLEQEFHEHRQVTEDVRHSAGESLREMRTLAQEIAQKNRNEERLANRVSTLEAQIDDWRTRHAKTQAHLRSLKASSMGMYVQQPTAPQYAEINSLVDARGLIKDTSVTAFQGTVDELLQLSRTGQPGDVLPYMRNIVSSVRSITGDVGKAAPHGDERRKKVELQVAAASNNLITTAKNHALSQGIAPLSLMDAAASHLTMAIIELVKLVKVRPTAEGELEDDDFR